MGQRYQGITGGSGVIPATASEIAALALGGTLVPGGLYFDAATGTHYPASSVASYSPLATSLHLGTVTLGTALAYVSPANGLTADAIDILPTGNPIRIRYNSTLGRWQALRNARNRTRVALSAFAGATYVTAGRWALPVGALDLFIGLEVKLKLDIPNETDTITSWRIKLGTAGTAADTDLLAPTGTPMSATDNQRGYNIDFGIESATSVRCDAVSNSPSPGWSGTAAAGNTADGSKAVANMASNAIYLGVDYTQGGTASSSPTVTTIYTLFAG